MRKFSLYLFGFLIWAGSPMVGRRASALAQRVITRCSQPLSRARKRCIKRMAIGGSNPPRPSIILFALLVIVSLTCSAGIKDFFKAIGPDDYAERIEGLEANNRAQQAEIEFLHSRLKMIEEQCAPPPAPPLRGNAMRDMVREKFAADGFTRTDDAMCILEHETTNYNPDAVNKEGEFSVGLGQINLRAWGLSKQRTTVCPWTGPFDNCAVTEEQAHDWSFTVLWMEYQINNGNIGIWTTWHNYCKPGHKHKATKRRRPR